MIRRSLNHKAFDIITDDAAYWIGFLFADGCIYFPQSEIPRVQVRISEVDRAQLVKLRQFLGSTHAIGYCPPGNFGGYASRASVRLSVGSERLASRLLELGRYDGPIAGELVSSPHFWRGIVDGDGSIYTTRTGFTGFGVVGSRRLLDAFLEFLKERNLARRMTVRPAKSIYMISTAGHIAELIIEELYRDGATALDRKAAAARPIIELARAARARAEADRASADAHAAELRQLYEAGATLVELGRHYGVSDVTILRRMRNAGIARRPAGVRKSAAPHAAA